MRFPDRGGWGFSLAVLAVTLIRLWALTTNATDLYVDEAQYWAWAQDPAWGYYSKPPLLAWLIAGAQTICGSSEACVRAPSPLLWGATAFLVHAVARRLFDDRSAFWAGLCALLAPGVAYSARIISTDVPLLFFWALAVLAFVRLRAGGGWGWSAVLAAAFGLGLLSKYAMIYLAPCLMVAALMDADSRRAVTSPRVWAALVFGTLFLIPNVLWNVGHDFATLRHTADNARGGGLSLGVTDALTFFAAQIALAGPVVFAAVLLALTRAARGRASGAQRLLVALSAPLWIALTGLALATRAHANWAAPALIAAFVLAPAVLSPTPGRRAWLMGGALAFGVLIQALLLWADPRAATLTVGGEPVYGRTVGWDAFGAAVAARARAEGLTTVVAERRRDVAALLYYARDAGLDVRAWPPAAGAAPEDHFQMSRPLTRGPVLAVSACPDAARYVGWSRVVPLGMIQTPAGGARTRRFHLFRLEGAGTVAPPRPCPEARPA